MTGFRLCCIAGSLIAAAAIADEPPVEGEVERIAAHFETASSRLSPGDVGSLDQFVSRSKATPGARLAVLIPATSEPARSRFMSARVRELDGHVKAFAGTVEYRHIWANANANADVLWLALVLPSPLPRVDEERPPLIETPVKSADMTMPAAAPLALTASASSAAASPTTADLRLADWSIRGVTHPAQGPAIAYIARTTPGGAPRELVEHQVDAEFGLVKEIKFSPEGGWTVRTEIGWIGR